MELEICPAENCVYDFTCETVRISYSKNCLYTDRKHIINLVNDSENVSTKYLSVRHPSTVR